jgi:flagellar hook assembly protein FlgD
MVEVTLKIYDTLGDLVRTVVDGEDLQGPDVVIPWDGRDDAGNIVKNGIYIYQIHVKGEDEEKTITKAIGVVKD